ncbi:MAG: O-antigen ligase family protein [Candidatus Binataceae bacterium]|nr:O-antigen ligase family protein [Candidatus Binataceae bacterium]
MSLSRAEIGAAAFFAVAVGFACALGQFGLLGLAALVAAILLGWFIFQRPELALKGAFFLLLVAQIKFRSRDATAALSGDIDSQVAVELALYALVAGISMINFLVILKQKLQPSFNERMLLAYVAIAVLSIGWSDAPKLTLVRATELAILYLFVFCAVRRLGPRVLLETFGGTLLITVLVCAGLAVVFPWASGTRISHELTEFSWNRQARFTWFAMQPIGAGAETGAAIVFLACDALATRGGWRRRLLGLPVWAYLIPLLVILAATRARGPLIATLAALLVILLRRYSQMRIISWAVLLTALVAGLAIMNVGTNFMTAADDLAGNPNAVMLFLMRGQSAGEFYSMTGRVGLWGAVFSLFTAQPILGHGYLGARALLLEILPWAGEAHNALAETLLDLGVAGFVVVWLPLIRTVAVSLNRSNPENGDWTSSTILGFLVFLLVDGISDTSFTGAVSYMPVMFMVTMIACRDVPAHARQFVERTHQGRAATANGARPGRRAAAFAPTGGYQG